MKIIAPPCRSKQGGHYLQQITESRGGETTTNVVELPPHLSEDSEEAAANPLHVAVDNQCSVEQKDLRQRANNSSHDEIVRSKEANDCRGES
ncbi:hypothetical protein ACFX2I_043549 [Malus domestica]